MRARFRCTVIYTTPGPGGTYIDGLIANFGDAHGKAMEEVEKCRLPADGPDDTSYCLSALLLITTTAHRWQSLIRVRIHFAPWTNESALQHDLSAIFRVLASSMSSHLSLTAASAPWDDECHDLAKDLTS